MSSPDTMLYLCTHCFRRFPWVALSKQEHRCPRCRLPIRRCAICDQRFEPREKEHLYCKRCDYNLMKHAAVMPPSMVKATEEDPDGYRNRDGASVTERWKEIQTAAGIYDEEFSDPSPSPSP
ncbi:protein FAM76A [Drosophila serrata]|uniref:protein FAM76A n=1 Tax=Drosophila serrata TaxID=7274 RepID=UPI000A1CF8AF|nr:protein FAM76A [Drosophila serrata]